MKKPRTGWKQFLAFAYPSYSQVDSLPLLIAVIDDLFPLDYSDRGRYTTDKLWHVLRMSHAVGISLICSCQLPLSRLNGISAATEHLFNVRIVLRTFRDSIFEALDASPSTASVELKEAIDNLSFGRPESFCIIIDMNQNRLSLGE